MCEQPSATAQTSSDNLTITATHYIQDHAPTFRVRSADSNTSDAPDYNTFTNNLLVQSCVPPTYCGFLGFKYLTGLLKVARLLAALTFQRAWFHLLQERVGPLLDLQDLVCILVAVKY